MMCSPKATDFIPSSLGRHGLSYGDRCGEAALARSGGGEAIETGEVVARRTDAWRSTIKVVFIQPPLRWDGGKVMRWSERW